MLLVEAKSDADAAESSLGAMSIIYIFEKEVLLLNCCLALLFCAEVRTHTGMDQIRSLAPPLCREYSIWYDRLFGAHTQNDGGSGARDRRMNHHGPRVVGSLRVSRKRSTTGVKK